MANYLELSKRDDALILNNASITCENHELKKRLEAILKENKALADAGSDLVEKNKKLEVVINAYSEENKILYEERAELKHKNAQLMELVEGLEEEVGELDNECNRLSDALEENEGQVIHYIAVSLDLELCVPLVSENPIQAGQELINKCLAKGVPYGGFKVFEKSELL
jgi:chromosome segregation ATPase